MTDYLRQQMNKIYVKPHQYLLLAIDILDYAYHAIIAKKVPVTWFNQFH
jgi:hypothetical protein